MFFYLITVAIIGYSFVNFKKGFMQFLSYKVILGTNIAIISNPGMPLLTVDMFMSIFYIFMYFVVGKRKKYRKNVVRFPYKAPMLFMVISWVISSLFSVAGILSEISSLIGGIIQDFLLILMIWEILESRNDFLYLVKGLTIIFLVTCLYGLVEYIIKTNPVLEYEKSLIYDPSKVIDFSYDIQQRGYRIRSFFEHAIGAGMNWAMYLIFVLFAMIQYKERLKPNFLILLTAALCIPCIFFTKMRAPLLFLLFGLLMLFEPSKKQFYRYAIFVVIALLVFLPLLGDNIDIFKSMFNSEYQSNVGGSTIEMRFKQLSYAWMLLEESPIWGLGTKYMSCISNLATQELLGVESIWFSVLPKYGLLGTAAYIYMAICQVILIPKKYSSKSLFVFSLGYWVVTTATSVPGMHVYLYYLLMFYMIKKTDKYSKRSIITS